MGRVALFAIVLTFSQVCNAAVSFSELVTIPGATSEQQTALLLWGIGGSFIILLTLGMSNRVVVFADGKDFLWTVCIFLIPIIALVIATTLVHDGQELSDDLPSLIVISIGGLLGLISCVMTFVFSIKHNGLLVGLVIGIFKVMAAMLAMLCAVGLLGKMFNRDRASSSARLLSIAIFGILLWAMTKLINGDNVYRR
ncbi:MAG: hypothetical protein GY922_13630 [Proteobacteria bacterium]|nr:hypothetical protein [Pseudomonadota bacterium]